MLLTCTVLLFTNCDNTTSPVTTGAPSTTIEKATPIDPFFGAEKDITVFQSVTLNAKRKNKTELGKTLDREIEAEIQRQLKLNPDLPLLNNVADAYNNLTISLYTELAKATGGEAYSIEDATFVVKAITEIIKTYMTDETDLVFLIDKTGSMSDDLEQIKKSINAIIDQIAAFENTRIGFAFYGDKNADKEAWYNSTPLAGEFTLAKKTVNALTVVGGGDGPESVNDGIAKTITEMNWLSGRRRVILLLGDAPSLEPPFADHSLEDVIAMAKSENVTMNFYPIIIGLRGNIKGISKAKTPIIESPDIITSIAPNPATNFALLKTNTSADYTVEVFDISGKLMFTKKFNDNNVGLLTDELITGVYIARIINNSDNTVDTEKFVVKH